MVWIPHWRQCKSFPHLQKWEAFGCVQPSCFGKKRGCVKVIVVRPRWKGWICGFSIPDRSREWIKELSKMSVLFTICKTRIHAEVAFPSCPLWELLDIGIGTQLVVLDVQIDWMILFAQCYVSRSSRFQPSSWVFLADQAMIAQYRGF